MRVEPWPKQGRNGGPLRFLLPDAGPCPNCTWHKKVFISACDLHKDLEEDEEEEDV